MTTRTFWTDERKEALAHYWAEGRSQTAIARLLSTPDEPCTKSMVHRKADRMGLPVRSPNTARADVPLEARREPLATHAAHDDRGCRWPEGDPRHWRDRTRFRFCGARLAAPDKPYCDDHEVLSRQRTIPETPARRAA